MVVRIFPLIGILFAAAAAYAQTSIFAYQGRLLDNGNPGSGSYDFVFKLFDQPTGGAQQGPGVERGAVPVSNGIFATQLDFGAGAFNGAERWLEIAVSKNGTAGPHTTLSPRQPITPAPYALHSTGGAGSFAGTFVGNGAGLTNLSVAGSGGGIGAFSGRVNQLPNSSVGLFAAASGFADATANEEQLTILSPGRNILAKDLHVYLNQAPGSGRHLVFTLRVNGVDTPVTCAIWDNEVSAHSGAASYVIPAASVVSLGVRCQGASFASSAMFSWSFE